ncbi:OsmC family protein [Lysinibacillus sp. NPDC047702]|uniref:OsmC family protein n=1 Tax=unclassified Lysinibacillus TaxID=2636778 RepID=UPI003D0455E5
MTGLKTNVNTVWYRNIKGNGRIKANQLQTQIAIPESFGGSGEGANPMEILVSAAAACYTSTLTITLDTQQLPIAGLTMDTEAIQSEEGVRIVHFPHIVLAPDATEEQVQSAREAVVTAEQNCFIGNMLIKGGVQIEVKGEASLSSEADVIRQYMKEHALDSF